MPDVEEAQDRNLPADPITRAIRNAVLEFQGPHWSEGHAGLVRLGRRLSDTLAQAIRTDVLSVVEPPEWSRDSSAIRRVFGMDRRHHLFRAEPIAWGVDFTEPQFTKGFAHFVNQFARVERTCALLKALGVERAPGIKLPDDRTGVCVRAEAWSAGARTAGRGRIDLLIDWGDSSNRYAIAVEAKLNSNFTPGQLAAYRDYLMNEMKIKKEHRMLVVVSPVLDAHTRRTLGRNKEWRWMAWRDLLIARERALSGDHDDDTYRQFRRTLWEQA